MFTNWLGVFTISVLLLGFCMWNQAQSQQTRDLSLYDKAGPYVIPLNIDAQSRDKMEADVREFLWTHWHQCRRGHVRVTQYSKEGEPSVSSYFVEPEKKGVWQIAIKIERTLTDRSRSKNQRDVSVEYGAYSVERIEVPKGRLTPRVIIPQEEERPPQSYRLVLKNNQGRLLAEI